MFEKFGIWPRCNAQFFRTDAASSSVERRMDLKGNVSYFYFVERRPGFRILRFSESGLDETLS